MVKLKKLPLLILLGIILINSNIGYSISPASNVSHYAGGKPETKVIRYHWQSESCVTAFNWGENSLWGMTFMPVREDTYNYPYLGPGAGLLSEKRCLSIIDESLTRFHSQKPGARIDEIYMDMIIDRHLWVQILKSLRRSMASKRGIVKVERGHEGNFPLELPPSTNEVVVQTIRNSDFITGLERRLRRRRYRIDSVRIDWPIVLKPSLDGTTWKKVAKRKDAGVLSTGKFLVQLSPLRTQYRK